jgi:hypothetical protein
MQDTWCYIKSINSWRFGILGGSVGPGAFVALIWQGKVTWWSCPDWPLLQKIIIINDLTILQSRIWSRGAGNASEWEALTQGTQEKTKYVAPHQLRVHQHSFWYLSCGVKYSLIQKWNGANRRPGWNLEIILQQYMQAILAGAFSAPIHVLTFTPELRGEWSRISKFREGTDWCSVWAMMYVLAVLHSLKIQIA